MQRSVAQLPSLHLPSTRGVAHTFMGLQAACDGGAAAAGTASPSPCWTEASKQAKVHAGAPSPCRTKTILHDMLCPIQSTAHTGEAVSLAPRSPVHEGAFRQRQSEGPLPPPSPFNIQTRRHRQYINNHGELLRARWRRLFPLCCVCALLVPVLSTAGK